VHFELIILTINSRIVLWLLENDLAMNEPFQQVNFDMEWIYLKNELISYYDLAHF